MTRWEQICPVTCAKQTLALLPELRQWVVARLQEVGSRNDLSVRQYAALRGIQEGATSPGELARLWQVTPAVITGIVDRLESRGMVRRSPDPQDRRKLQLTVTEEGRRALDEVEQALTNDVAGQLAQEDQVTLCELSRSLALLRRTFVALGMQTHSDELLPDDVQNVHPACVEPVAHMSLEPVRSLVAAE